MNHYLRRISSVLQLQLIPLSIFFFFCIVYSWTMIDGFGGRIHFGDSAKWQFLSEVNGLPHGTGYPQYLMWSEFFSRVIFFLPPPERITFISVFFGAATLAVLYLLIKLLTGNKSGSVVSVLFFGFSHTFWMQATEAEVYTLNTFYLVAVFYFYLKFYLTKEIRYFFSGCAIYALSFGNHLSMITILPAIVWIIVMTDYKILFKIKNLLVVLVFILMGMSQYLFTYIRAHSSDLKDIYAELPLRPSLKEFANYSSGTDKSIMFNYNLKDTLTERLPVFYSFVNENFTVFGLILILSGFFLYLFRKKNPVILSFLSLSFLGQFVFSITYDVGDLIVFFIPVYLLLGIFASLLFSEYNHFFLKLIFLLVAITNVFYLDGYKKVIEQPVWYFAHFEPKLYLQEQGDAVPLYIESNLYNTKACIFNYNLHEQLNHKKKLVHSTDSLSKFHINGDLLPQFSDTAKYKITLERQMTITDFVRSCNDKGLAVFISATDEATNSLPEDFKMYMSLMGSSIRTLAPRGSYAAAIYKGKLCDEVNNEGPVKLRSHNGFCDPLKNELEYKIYSAGFLFGNTSIFTLRNRIYRTPYTGLNIMAVNTESKRMAHFMTFNTYLGEIKQLYLIEKK